MLLKRAHFPCPGSPFWNDRQVSRCVMADSRTAPNQTGQKAVYLSPVLDPLQDKTVGMECRPSHTCIIIICMLYIRMHILYILSTVYTYYTSAYITHGWLWVTNRSILFPEFLDLHVCLASFYNPQTIHGCSGLKAGHSGVR